MDLLLTWVILHYDGGREANALANAVLQRFGLVGLVAYKFVIVMAVISICEVVGRRRYNVGKGLAWGAMLLTCIPILVSFYLMLDPIQALD